MEVAPVVWSKYILEKISRLLWTWRAVSRDIVAREVQYVQEENHIFFGEGVVGGGWG